MALTYFSMLYFLIFIHKEIDFKDVIILLGAPVTVPLILTCFIIEETK